MTEDPTALTIAYSNSEVLEKLSKPNSLFRLQKRKRHCIAVLSFDDMPK